MTAQLSPAPVFRATDNNGNPLYQGQLGTFIAGTSTPQATYVDSTQTTPNTNPIILNARGECFLWLDPTKVYKFVLSDSFGNLIWTVDNINGALSPNASLIPAVDNLYTLGSPSVSWANLYLGPAHSPALDTTTGIIGYWPRTAIEIAAGVTPVSFGYPPYDVRRYGAVGDGSTNDTPFFNVAGSLPVPIFVPDPPVAWTLNGNVTGSFESFNYPKIQGPGTISLRNLAFNDADQLETIATQLEAGTSTILATFGDSTMWGADPANLANQVAIPPYAQLQGFLNNFYGNSACVVQNFSISGTTLQQMLAGTDGSGLTYYQRCSGTGALACYCNHGINDAFGPNATSAAVYRAGLIAFIRITRGFGKTPILVTPHPALTIATFGSQARASATARFANIMRTVAQQHGVQLIDNNAVLAKMMQADVDINQVNVNRSLSLLPDGIHGFQQTYLITGNNLADAVCGSQVETLTKHNQRITATRANSNATGQTISASTTSRNSAAITSNVGVGQSLRILFRIGETGLDVSLMHPIYSNGAAQIAVNLDGLGAGSTTFPSGLSSFGQLQAGFTTSFLQDVETVILRNASLGLHLLTLTTTTSGAVAWNAIKVRNTEKPVNLGSTAVDPGLRQLLVQRFAIPSGATGNVIEMTDIPLSRFIDLLEIEWTGQMTKNSAVCVVANVGTNTGSPSPQQMLMFGLNASGFASVSEASGPGTFTAGAFDAVDHSAASHVYRVQVASATPGTCTFFIDDVQVGSPIALGQPFYGGWLGVWKNLNTDVMSLTNISRVWRF